MTQHLADLFAWIVAGIIGVVAGRFVRRKKQGLQGIRGTILALGLGFCAGTACRFAVLFAQSRGFFLEREFVGSVGTLSVSALVTTITRYGIQSAVFEEAAIRGYLQFRIASVWGRWFSIVYGALFTVAIHFGTDGFTANIPVYLALGIMLGWIAQMTGSLLAVIAFHLVFNTSGLLIELVASKMFDRETPLAIAYSNLFPTELLLFVLAASAVLTTITVATAQRSIRSS